MRNTTTTLFIISIIIIISGLFSCNSEKENIRVIVLGLDGLRPDAIEKARTPNLHKLIMDGTSTMKARAVYPTSSGANWSSMLLGCGPDQHGIDRNDWTLDTRKVTPVFEKENGYSPSVFDVIKEKYPDSRTSAVLDWYTIINYFDATEPDTTIDVTGTKEAIDNIITEVVDNNSVFVFSQIDHMDHAGHSMGYGSENYNLALERLDSEIGRLIDSLKENGIYENTYIIALSDHGGIGTGHGGKSIEEYTIPFIITGPGITKGKLTSELAYTFDVAAIVAHIFNCRTPDYWIGTNLISAFGQHDELLADFIPKAIITVDSIDNESSFLKCQVYNSDQKIKYSIPKQDDNWHDYNGQLVLPHGDSIYASVFINNKPTRVSYYKVPVIKHVGNKSKVELTTAANSKYQARGAQSLTDGLISANEAFKNDEWLGFQGDDLECVIKFDIKKEVNHVKFRFLENVKSWIFLPVSVRIYTSNDGTKFKEIASDNKLFNIDYDNTAIKEYQIEFNPVETNYLKVKVENYGQLPDWHSGAGENAWLFTDEIVIE